MAPADTIGARELDGAAIGELRDLIVKALPAGDLEQLVRIKMNIKLYDDLVSRELKGSDLVYQLIDAVQQRGITILFLRAVLEARPNLADLRDAIARHCPEALQAPPKPGEEANPVVAGVEMLKKQLKSPAVRNVVTASRDKLKQLMEDVDVLASYKALHDCLHTIELLQYPYIVDNLKRLRTEPLAPETLDAHVDQLRAICSKARNAAQSLPDIAAVRAQELQWVATLESATADLSKAVNNLDDQGAAQAVRSLRQVIRQEPFRVNALLKLTAEKVSLEDLVQTIEKVTDAVSAGGAPALDLQNALRSLQNILPQLRGRVAEHNQWQDIENELWGADEFVVRGTPESVEEFNLLWPTAKSRVDLLARIDPEAPWAKASQKFAGLIDKDLAGQIDSARINFRRFRKEVLGHFFEVDKALQSQCAAILNIREPMSSLLKEV